MRNRPGLRPVRAALVAVALLALAPSSPEAHEVPASVAVQVYVRPVGDRLSILARVPLAAMRDFDFPLLDDGVHLDIGRADTLLVQAAKTWIADYIAFFEDGRPLPAETVLRARISLPTDRSFAMYETAVASIAGARLPDEVRLPRGQALLDAMLEVPITSERARFSVIPELAHLGVRTLSVIHFQPATPAGEERPFQFIGNPGLVHLDPAWQQAAWQFVALGFDHILDGLDHLLFILCLVIPLRRIKPLVAVVTSFTVAHSITLMASAFGFAPDALWFPPLVETLIALSIVYMAFENIVGARVERRWLLTFGFGLIHGFGFSFLLRDSLQFAGSHLVTSLLAFNVGVELGQLLVVALAIPVLALLFRRVVSERIGTIILSALIAHTAWHWMTERGGALLEYQFAWPATDLALAAAALRAVMLLLIVSGAAWLLHGAFAGWLRHPASGQTAPPTPPDGAPTLSHPSSNARSQ